MVAASEPDIETVDVLPKLNFDVSDNDFWRKEVMNVVMKSNYSSVILGQFVAHEFVEHSFKRQVAQVLKPPAPSQISVALLALQFRSYVMKFNSIRSYRQS